MKFYSVHEFCKYLGSSGIWILLGKGQVTSQKRGARANGT